MYEVSSLYLQRATENARVQSIKKQLIARGMFESSAAEIAERYRHIDWLPDEDEIIDDRLPISDCTRQRMQEKSLTFPCQENPLPVIMVTDIRHTPSRPVCGDPDCICEEEERKAQRQNGKETRRQKPSIESTDAAEMHRMNAPLHSNGQGFTLMR